MKRSEVIKLIQELFNDAMRVYQENGKTDFDAGRADGIKQVFEAITTNWHEQH